MKIHQVYIRFEAFTNLGAVGMHFYLSPFQILWLVGIIIWLISLLVYEVKYADDWGADLIFIFWTFALIIILLIVGYFV